MLQDEDHGGRQRELVIKMEKKRIVWIDSLKGFATICVVLGHIANGYLSANLFPESRTLLRDLYNGVYLFHMALFFSLSGMTFQISYRFEIDGDGSKLRAQIRNIVFLYVLYCCLNWAFKLLTAAFVNHPVKPTDILLIWAKPISPYWYFYVLIIFYFLFSRKFTRGRNPIALILTLFILSLSSGFVQTNGWFELDRILYYAFFFYLGFALADKQFSKLISPLPAGIAAAVSLSFAMIFWKNKSFICNIPIVNAVVATGVVLGMMCLFSRVKAFDKRGLLSYIGRHSLEIYVIHCFLTAGNRVVFSRLAINNVWASIGLNLLLSTCGSLAFAALTKKIGVYDLFFRPYALIKKKNES